MKGSIIFSVTFSVSIPVFAEDEETIHQYFDSLKKRIRAEKEKFVERAITECAYPQVSLETVIE